MRVGVYVGCCVVLALLSTAQAQTQPALQNILDLTHVLTESDPTMLRGVSYLGKHDRHMGLVVDGRWAYGDYLAHVFEATFDARQVEFEVHSEIGGRAEARAQVDVYALIFGQIPASLMGHLQQVEIHQTGGHAMQARRYNAGDPNSGAVNINIAFVAEHNMRQRGFLEEFTLHETVHVSWDNYHLRAPGWLEAQQNDPGFITLYARDYPDREDLADTAVAWFAVRYRPETISSDQYDVIIETIPNRLAYLDRQNFDMSPYVRDTPVPALPLVGLLLLATMLVAAGSRRRAVRGN